MSACDLTGAPGIGRPTVGHRTRKLVDAGLLARGRRGGRAHGSVVPAASAELRAALHLG